jgi:hypothetical protein
MTHEMMSLPQNHESNVGVKSTAGKAPTTHNIYPQLSNDSVVIDFALLLDS